MCLWEAILEPRDHGLHAAPSVKAAGTSSLHFSAHPLAPGLSLDLTTPTKPPTVLSGPFDVGDSLFSSQLPLWLCRIAINCKVSSCTGDSQCMIYSCFHSRPTFAPHPSALHQSRAQATSPVRSKPNCSRGNHSMLQFGRGGCLPGGGFSCLSSICMNKQL